MKERLYVVAALCLAAVPAFASTSYYTQKLDDPKAVYVTKQEFGLHGDGVADDSDAIQQAIDKVESTTHQGIVFLPEGHYRITKTIYVWPGIRVIGYGATRPVLMLAPNTPGYQNDIGYMVFFTGNRHGARRGIANQHDPFPGTVPPNNQISDANPGTFYSGMSNIDFEIGEGNPNAVGIRFRVAQHCFLTHMDFHTGSGLAALHDIGNEAEDLHFYGGRYGIMTRKPSPGWQFTLVDSTFEGQREAAIKEHEAGLTLIHDEFRHVPAAVTIDPTYSDELWITRSRFVDISGPAITISNENSPRTEINLKDVFCDHVATFAAFRESGKTVKGLPGSYMVRDFTHGLTMVDNENHAEVKTTFQAVPEKTDAAMPDAIRNLPARDTWTNLRALGAKGDGVTDDTAAIQKAINEHATIYVPSGRYLVSDTIHLKPDTVMIGLHPSTTQFDLADSTPGFETPGAPRAVVEAPRGGSNIFTGIGIYGGGINGRAVGILWQAGKDSLIDDVKFLGGHGTFDAEGKGINPYNNTHTADPDLKKRWDGQYPSLWVTNGGGGTFADIWTADTYAQAGIYVSDTDTEGHVYELSSEHHVRNEMKLNRVSNWEVFALQTEEERGEGGFCLPLEIDGSKNLLFANYHSYRVVSTYQPFPYAIKVSNSSDIRLRNMHVYSDSKASFDSAVFDQTHKVEIRAREAAAVTFTGAASSQSASTASPLLAEGTRVKKLADGFFNISGAAVDPKGQLYFVDAHWQKIYRWSDARQEVDTVRDNPLDPVNLFFDKAGDLLVTSYAGDGTVYWFRPDAPATEINFLKPEPTTARTGQIAVLPNEHWRNENDFIDAMSVAKPYQYVSPDGSTFLPAGEDFVKGALYYGIKMADLLRGYGLAKNVPGHPFYVTEESGQKTYSARIGDDGSLTDMKLFAERGGESVVQDSAGNVYLAAGQVFVYSPQGKLLETIRVPERPINLVFGGKGGRTLYILSRQSLYSVETKNAGLGLK
ncbi:glycosyl hydrolase family 28-related protein [Silvibacterium acidisoli]|uniref:glycosyl hydrolase family 28-related protein n=1 Tax=Acidobacteriaceae bacterium ZG23-2 TaxID=2883246 RepID=UPI00406BEB74